VEQVFSSLRGIYCNRTRRWICVSLRLTKDEGFRREFFLIDTGAPKSIIISDLAQNLLKENSPFGCWIDIEGVKVEFEIQAVNGANAQTQGINLLGTNFLNSVILVDDFGSKTIMVLRRALGPSHRW